MSHADRDKWNTRYSEGAYSARLHPSPLIESWIDQAPPGRALDIACGAGRNALYLAGRGFEVDAIDISRAALDRAGLRGDQLGLSVNWSEHDLDAFPTLDCSYQLILIVRYVNLPLVRRLTSSLAPGGLLLCEQHLATDVEVIGPANPAYRVKPDELRGVAGGLGVLHYMEGLVSEPDGGTAALAQLVARAPR